MAECPLVWSGFDSTSCPEREVLHEGAWGGEARWPGDSYSRYGEVREAAARKMLGHASPSVRYAAAHDLYFTNTDENRGLVAGAIAREQDPTALRAMAETFASGVSLHPKLAEQVLRLAEHERPEIRRAIFLRGLGDGRGVPGVFEVLSRHAETDPDAETRRYACKALGEIGDPRAMPVLEKLLVPATDPYLYDDCLAGLVALWSAGENAHQPAYRRTLEILGKATHPADCPLSAIWSFSDVVATMEEHPELGKARRFVKVAELEKALVAIAGSDREAPSAREGAVDELAELGAKKQVFQKLRKTLPAAPAEDSPLAYLAEKIDEAISAAP
jgi:HEAT repeat protein